MSLQRIAASLRKQHAQLSAIRSLLQKERLVNKVSVPQAHKLTTKLETKLAMKPLTKLETKPPTKLEVKTVTKPVTKLEAKLEKKPAMKLETKPAMKQDPQPDVNLPRIRFVQYRRKNDMRKRLGVVTDDGKTLIELSGGSCVQHDMIHFINQDISMQEIHAKVENLRQEAITDNYTLLPPVTNPGKIICIGLNYKDHCDEQKKPVPKEPIFFSKYPNAIIGPTDNVIANKITDKIDWEAELAVIIGKKAQNVPKEKAMDYVFGYTIAQDISARDWQKKNGGQFLIGKSMDTFCPLGPAIVHKSFVRDVNDLNLKTLINGVEKQQGNTKEMVFKIDDVISRLSQCITLIPGDIILTGTPKGVGMYRDPPEYLKPGDVIQTEIDGMGRLINTVVAP